MLTAQELQIGSKTMKQFIIAACIIGVVTADVSHLSTSEHGYNYDKPSLVFETPAKGAAPQNQFAGHSNEYTAPHSHYSAPASAAVPQQEFSQPIQGPTNEYLPPQSFPPSQIPVHQPDISEPKLHSGPVHAQQHYPPPPSEYLPPQIQQSSPGLDPVHHPEIPQTGRAPHPQYSVPFQTPTHYQENVQTPSSDYLPPASVPVQQQEIVPHPQYSLLSQNPVQYPENIQTAELPPAHHHQNSPPPANEYLPPHAQQPTPYFSSPSYPSAPAMLPIPIGPTNEYLAPPQPQTSIPAVGQGIPHFNHATQPQYSLPSQGLIHHQHNTASSPPTNEYLPPQSPYSAPAERDYSTSFTATANDYIPPHQQYSTLGHVPDHIHQPQFPHSVATPPTDHLPPVAQHPHAHAHPHHGPPQQASHSDGYHYDAPAKQFRFLV